MNISTLFRWDALSGFIVLGIVVFTLLTLIYSLGFLKSKPRRFCLQYYTYIILTSLASIGAVLADNLFLLLVFWGFLGPTLYLLIDISGEASAIAKKTFIIVGGADVLMLLGFGIIYQLTGTLAMSEIKISLDPFYFLTTAAYLCLACAAFAKAGAIPLHSWIPDCAKDAPVPVVAFLPASLDKLLGIYLLARLSLDLFVMNTAMNMFLMLIGAFTIIAAVMMALIQHDMKRLLGYHAVSQVGYMVLGIGTGSPLGIAGGIFHMLNHAIYKSCLFFTAGNVEKEAGTTDLDKLGGLARTMPLTYICALVASLSISGVPPFNGFFSKWMIYQGLIYRFTFHVSRFTDLVVIICLAAAMFGSGLTLASFVKLLHAVFLGQPTNQQTSKPANEVSWQMWLPCIILAGLCVLFGVFAREIPLKYFILPAVGGVTFLGSWDAGLASGLIILGLIIGLCLVRLKSLQPKLRRDSAYTGAETRDLPFSRLSGTDFYQSIRDLGLLKWVYKKAEAGWFDLYEQLKNFIFGVGRFLQYLHNGVLPTYLIWTLLGMLGLFYFLR